MKSMELASCPIPRCALEWALVAWALGTGICISLFGDARLGTDLIFYKGFTLQEVRFIWGLLLTGGALIQMFSLYFGGYAPQKYAALILAFVWFALGMNAAEHQMRSMAMPNSFTCAGLEFFVFFMLRGGKWRRKKDG